MSTAIIGIGRRGPNANDRERIDLTSRFMRTSSPPRLCAFGTPGIRDMPRPPPRSYNHDIESKRKIAPFRVMRQEHRGRAFDAISLRRRDGLKGFRKRSPALHLDDGDQAGAFGDDIEFAHRRGIASGKNTPAGKTQADGAPTLGGMAAGVGSPPCL
jgi:hypothetical protein